jgi:D-alanyl-D-alanine carboxypeptidase
VSTSDITKKRPPVWLLRIIAAIVAVGSIVIFAPWLSAVANLKPLPDTVQEQVDDAINFEPDGIIVYVDRIGEGPQFYAAGWKDRELLIPADPHALFKIASISKLYIAAATAMLISDNQLDLDDTVADYFPELVGKIKYADRITLRMLLQHRSGIPNWDEDPDRWAISSTDVNDYLGLVFDDPADFEPGDRYDYSNTNYLLIGNILDQALGYHHQLYLRREILDSLGLTSTFALLTDVDLARVSSGVYRRTGPKKYSWRSTYISLSLKAGVPPGLVAKQAGQNERTTRAEYADNIAGDNDDKILEDATESKKESTEQVAL